MSSTQDIARDVDPYIDDIVTEKQVTKLSELHDALLKLHRIELQQGSLFEIKGTADFRLQDQKIQTTIMEIVDRLKNMRFESKEYYQKFIEEHEWAKHVMDVFDDVNFTKTGVWSAFI